MDGEDLGIPMFDVEQEGLFDEEPVVADEPPAPGQESIFTAAEVPLPPTPGDEEMLTDDDGQATMFGETEDFNAVWAEWRGMPSFTMDDLMPWYQIVVNFAAPEDLAKFGELVGIPLAATQRRTTSMWYPPQLRFGPSAVDKRYRDPRDERYWQRVPQGGRLDPNAKAVKAE